MNGPVELGWWQLAVAASLVLANGGVSLWLGLGLEKRLLVAALRTAVQLAALGAILVPVFSLERWELVGALVVVMLGAGTHAAVGRVSRRQRGIHLAAFASLAAGGLPSAVFGCWVVLGVDPWWTPQYLVPLLGMVLGNTLTGISLGLEGCLRALDEGRDRVELYLARGASWWEAARPVARASLKTALVPIVNSMTVVGLVSIPGMMTGQILGGTEPMLAARYQILVMYLIAGGTALGSLAAVLVVLRLSFDEQVRLRRPWKAE